MGKLKKGLNLYYLYALLYFYTATKNPKIYKRHQITNLRQCANNVLINHNLCLHLPPQTECDNSANDTT